MVVHEKGDCPGGSLLLSSGVVWRYKEWKRFRAECPGGDPKLQRLVWERLDDALLWLQSLGAPVVAYETGNPDTAGLRFDPRRLTDALVRRAGEIRLGEPLLSITVSFAKPTTWSDLFCRCQFASTCRGCHLKAGTRNHFHPGPWTGP